MNCFHCSKLCVEHKFDNRYIICQYCVVPKNMRLKSAHDDDIHISSFVINIFNDICMFFEEKGFWYCFNTDQKSAKISKIDRSLSGYNRQSINYIDNALTLSKEELLRKIQMQLLFQ